MAYGGVAAKTIMGPATAKALCGQLLTQETLHRALQAVAEDVNISANAPGGQLSHAGEQIFSADESTRRHRCRPTWHAGGPQHGWWAMPAGSIVQLLKPPCAALVRCQQRCH